MKYVKGYTIQELLIGIVISSIIINLVYVFITLFNKQLLIYFKTNQNLMEVNQFRQIFSKDLALSSNVFYNNDKLEMFFNNDIYKYVFYEDKIVRTTNTTETQFFIKSNSISLDEVFVNKEKYYELKLNLIILKDTIALYEAKRKPIDVLINKEVFYEH